MVKADIRAARAVVRVHFTSSGSVFAGTISSTCHAVETELVVESSDDPAKVAALVQNAEGGCYAQSALVEPVPVTNSVILNGEPLDYTSFPRRLKRR